MKQKSLRTQVNYSKIGIDKNQLSVNSCENSRTFLKIRGTALVTLNKVGGNPVSYNINSFQINCFFINNIKIHSFTNLTGVGGLFKVILVGTGVQLKLRKHPNAYIAIK